LAKPLGTLSESHLIHKIRKGNWTGEKKERKNIATKKIPVLIASALKYEKAVKTLEPYVLRHLGKACQDFAETQGSMIRGQKFPDRSEPGIKEKVEKVRDQQLAYIEKILADLRNVKHLKIGGSQV